MWLLAFTLSVIGSGSFALVIDRHWRAWIGERVRSEMQRLTLRMVGIAFLIVSVVVCATNEPLEIAVLLWAVTTMLAIGAVATGCAFKVGNKKPFKSPK